MSLQIVVFQQSPGCMADRAQEVGKSVNRGLQKHFRGRKWQMVQAGGCEEEETLEGVYQASEAAKGEVSTLL